MYDATPFLKEHPGGGDSILIVAGTDATEEFDAIHSAKAKAQLLEYCIGNLADENVAGARLRPGEGCASCKQQGEWSLRQGQGVAAVKLLCGR